MEFLYQFLQQHGFGHPLHPPLTHMPIGLIGGACIFLLFAILFKRENFVSTARHCIVLALIFMFPATFLGFTDWQHFYSGAWLFPIKMKIIITAVLFVLLAALVIMEIKNIGGLMSRSFAYFLCLLSVIGLGYLGGSLVFPEKSLALSDELKAGEKLYTTHCGGCHPGGGNVINKALPVIGAPQLKSLGVFTKYNRDPLRPDGSKGVMPAFPKEKLSDEEMKLIYQYVTKGLTAKPAR
jgi:uncharacterized membrane protein